MFSQICASTFKTLLFFNTPVLPHCPSPSNVWRRTTELTSESPGLSCRLGPPSTWMARHSTRLWRPSSSLRSTTWRWTLVRSSPSGKCAWGWHRIVIAINWFGICVNNAVFRLFLCPVSLQLRLVLEQPAYHRLVWSPWSLCWLPLDCRRMTSPSS